MTQAADITVQDASPGLAALNRVEQVFATAPDPAFRARCVSEYKRLHGWVRDRVDWSSARILDFGCGEGHAAASIALRHPGAQVVGLDVVPVSVSALRLKLEAQTKLQLPPNLEWVDDIDDGSIAHIEFDVAFAWSVLEHVSREWLVETLSEIRERLRPGGYFFVWCDPLYHSPRGSLLHRYDLHHWHHLLTSLEQLRETVLSQSSATSAREWQQFLELNRLTADDILEAGVQAGFQVDRELRFRTEQRPPERLLRIYDLDVLTTTSTQILFVKR